MRVRMCVYICVTYDLYAMVIFRKEYLQIILPFSII